MKTGKFAAGVLASLAIVASGGCGGGDPDGLYIMTRMGFGSLNVEAYRFGDGNVVRNPLVPGASLDVDEERKAHPNDVGTYEIDGDEMTMTFGSSQSKSEMERDGECFTWDMGIFCPVKPFDDDTIAGTFSGGVSAHGLGGGFAMNSRTITFSDDGTYTMESAASFTSNTDSSTASGGSTGGEKGEYEIDGQVITFEPEGGEARTVTAFPFDDGTDGPQPRRIYLGGTMLKHE
ncbi:MAG TPA: hypothetical protein VFL14_13750 [Xanthomonadales bacterium]|nr:hypothetical protein [Xanthomonadales bacterium]